MLCPYRTTLAPSKGPPTGKALLAIWKTICLASRSSGSFPLPPAATSRIGSDEHLTPRPARVHLIQGCHSKTTPTGGCTTNLGTLRRTSESTYHLHPRQRSILLRRTGDYLAVYGPVPCTRTIWEAYGPCPKTSVGKSKHAQVFSGHSLLRQSLIAYSSCSVRLNFA